MLDWLLVLAAIFCAYGVVRSERLLSSAVWLAGVSAMVSIMLYRIGAPEVAVIELSVGAGLVTVLFVFAFSIVGDDTMEPTPVVPVPVGSGLALLVAFLLGWYTLPVTGVQAQAAAPLPFAHMLWEQRGLDVLAQIALIFAGVMGLIGLMAEAREPGVESARLKGEFHSLPDRSTIEGQLVGAFPGADDAPTLHPEELEEVHA